MLWELGGNAMKKITILALREDEKPRILCIISKKIAKKAYQRNLIRRRTYHLVIQNKEYFSKMMNFFKILFLVYGLT